MAVRVRDSVYFHAMYHESQLTVLTKSSKNCCRARAELSSGKEADSEGRTVADEPACADCEEVVCPGAVCEEVACDMATVEQKLLRTLTKLNQNTAIIIPVHEQVQQP